MTAPSPGASRLVEANMRRWLERKKLDEKIAEDSKRPSLGPYIVISRQCGANGALVARSISDNLGWELIDREIVEAIAKDYDISERMVEFVDERHVAWITEIFEAFIERKDFCQESFVYNISKFLMIAAQRGNFVMVGRGAQFILPREFGLFVRLHAPMETRVSHVMRSKGMTASDSGKYINETEQRRAKYLKTYFQSDGTDPELYDLAIDTSRFNAASAAGLIQQAARMREFQE